MRLWGGGATTTSWLSVPLKYRVLAGLGLLPHRLVILACTELTTRCLEGGPEYQRPDLELSGTRTCCAGMRD